MFSIQSSGNSRPANSPLIHSALTDSSPTHISLADITRLMSDCTLCPRECHANRQKGIVGFCGEKAEISAARASLHQWEEPCISGTQGSGTVFFSGCSLKCVFCQNHDIALGKSGYPVSPEHLAEIFLALQEKGAHNINLVTPSHFIPQIAYALEHAKRQGLVLPVVYNTGCYEKVSSLRILDGLVDIYLPDCKYYSSDLSLACSHAADYFERAVSAIAEMFRQTGVPSFDSDTGLMQKGIIVRHLILPGQGKDSKKIIRYLHETYGDNIYISIMNQYTPMPQVFSAAHTSSLTAAAPCIYQELTRKVSDNEYRRIIDFALRLGVRNGFIQEGETADESFIPDFDGRGIITPL